MPSPSSASFDVLFCNASHYRFARCFRYWSAFLTFSEEYLGAVPGMDDINSFSDAHKYIFPYLYNDEESSESDQGDEEEKGGDGDEEAGGGSADQGAASEASADA